MSRAFLIPICAFGLFVSASESEARRAKAPAAKVLQPAPARIVKVKPAPRVTVKRAQPGRTILANQAQTKPSAGKVARLGRTGTTVKSIAQVKPTAIRPIPRIRVKDALGRLPNGERRQMLALIASPRAQGSMQVRRAVAAYLLLRGFKGGGRLPISIADLHQMTTSKRWSPKRMANFAIVLRTAVGIAKAEGLSANAAFQRALKLHGIQKKYNRGVCGA